MGLAWTSVGGAVLFIEAAKMRGKGQLKVTGWLKDVMTESDHQYRIAAGEAQCGAVQL